MYKAIAHFGAVLILSSVVPAANAQVHRAQVNAEGNMAQPHTEVQTEPMGSASSLQGLQERTIKHSFPKRMSAEAGSINKVNDSTDTLALQLDKNVQLRVKPETDASQSGVFPGDNNAKGNQFQLIYQFDDQLEQFSRSQR